MATRARWARRTVALAVALGFAATGAAPALAADYAPVDTPGPALSPTAAELEASVKCTENIATAGRQAVLLTPATGVNSDQNFGFNYERAFRATGTPYCTSDVPGAGNNNMQDIQRRGEFVTFAIRRTYQLSGRRIAILGHSQGGMVMRWSLRFWPDTRPMVEDVIGMAASNHGTTGARSTCTTGCPPAVWQQRDDAAFIAALNSRQETFAGIDYTAIYTRNDQVVMPNQDDTGSSSLRAGPGRIENVALQEICPATPSEHLAIGTSDPIAYALVRDALDNDGPANPDRVDRAVCAQPFQPGIDPATFAADTAASGSALAASYATTPPVPAEPPLACYVTATCPTTGGSGGTGGGSGAPGTSPAPSTPSARTCTSRRRFTVTIRRKLRGVRVTLAGKRIKTKRRNGRLVATVDLRRRGKGATTLRITGRDSRGRKVTLTRRYHPCQRTA